MSRDLGRDVPDLENLMQENFGLIFRTLISGPRIAGEHFYGHAAFSE